MNHHQLRGNAMQRRCGLLTALLLSAALLQPAVRAESIPVKYREGTVRGFLVLRTLDGKAIAAGDILQVASGDRITIRLTFHFTDGSLDDETTVFSQNKAFRLISYRHVQKGPSYPDPIDLSIDAGKGRVTVKSTKDGKEKVETKQMKLEADLANGLLPILLKNLPGQAGETKVSFLAATPDPRLVKLAITSDGQEEFAAAGTRHPATVYNVKVEIGGIAGVVAPVIGKQPKDIRVWVLRGDAPAFVRLEGQLYPEGPVWRIEQVAPVWPAKK